MSGGRQDYRADPGAPEKAGFLADERGATAIEYALIAGFLSIAILLSVSDVGAAVVAFFTTVSNSF